MSKSRNAGMYADGTAPAGCARLAAPQTNWTSPAYTERSGIELSKTCPRPIPSADGFGRVRADAAARAGVVVPAARKAVAAVPASRLRRVIPELSFMGGLLCDGGGALDDTDCKRLSQ
ncbi:hypothetical protein ACFV9C_39145 [Kribbella sp. NPDC059898]|uniref:hypothetical protein n=1 Tax=Kribbella sp. NPDC059898 TaxID=3346995 RepID=UPI00364C3661